MLNFLYPYFNIENFGSKTKTRKQNNPNYMLRDDLDKKKSIHKLNERENKVAEGLPLLHKEKESREGTKVKILMTKEEAARLLSKCKDGGVLEFKDVARELVQIPASRVSVISSGKGEDCVLELGKFVVNGS